MRIKKLSPRIDHRQKESQRANQSATLAEKYEELKALTVAFAYLGPDGNSRNRNIKYTVNVERARSVFRIDCINHDCVGGDFDLSDLLEEAVLTRQNSVTGELRCQGWQNSESINRVPCHHILSFKLDLTYQRRSAGAAAGTLRN